MDNNSSLGSRTSLILRFDASSYHKSADAPLRRFPLEAAVDVVAGVDEERDAASDSVEVTQQQLRKKQKKKKEEKDNGEFH